jgi:hypothetical protein
MAAVSRAEYTAGLGVGCAVALAEVGMAVSAAVDMVVVVEATDNQIVESILKEEKLNGGK